MQPTVQSFQEAGRILVLRDLGTHHELLLDQVPILTSAALATELAFGELAAKLSLRPAARVLIGGLGFGATAAAALRVLGPNAEVTVVEKLGTVIELVRAGTVCAQPGLLEDPRLHILQADVADALANTRDLDVILFDVDNGPQWASFRSNARLYASQGLHAAREALAPGGSFAVWSGYPADRFIGQMRRADLLPSVVPLCDQGRIRARAYVGKRPLR